MTPARSSFDQFTVMPTEMRFYFGTPLFAIQAVGLLQGLRSSRFFSRQGELDLPFCSNIFCTTTWV